MKVIAKILGKLIGWILYPFFWMLWCGLALACVIFDEIEKLRKEDI